MNIADQERWDRKYRDKEIPAEITPDPFLARNLQGIAPGRALDIGCGLGDNAMAMAKAGFDVTAIDISGVAIERAIARAQKNNVNIRFLMTDVEDFDYGEGVYDLITGFYFLNRNIFRRIKKGLKPEGLFLYQTYTLEELHYRPELNRDYLLGAGELKERFSDFDILLYDERDNGKEGHARIIARRQAHLSRER